MIKTFEDLEGEYILNKNIVLIEKGKCWNIHFCNDMFYFKINDIDKKFFFICEKERDEIANRLIREE